MSNEIKREVKCRNFRREKLKCIKMQEVKSREKNSFFYILMIL